MPLLETREMKTSVEEVKSTETKPLEMMKSYKILAVCYYSVLVAVVTLTMTLALREDGKACENTTCINYISSFKQTSLLKSDPTRETQLKNEESNVETQLNEKMSLIINIEIQSNPFNLNNEEIIRQLRTAKVASLKARVKRFACWHSCFGQFRKKAFRTLYGNLGSLFSSPGTNMLEEKRERKREIGIETAKLFNDLGEGENKEDLKSTHGTNSKSNTTDFLKLKTKVVPENDEEKSKSDVWDVGTSIPSSMPTYRDDGSRNFVSEKSSWNLENQNPTEVTDEVDSNETEDSEFENGEEDDYDSEEDDKEDENYDENNEENESKFEGSYEYDEYSTSEELEEDKGDGIDRKDLEEEGMG